METIMEHLAHESGKDPVELRLANILQVGDDLITREEDYPGPNQIDNIIAQIKVTCDYDNRKVEVDAFNQVTGGLSLLLLLMLLLPGAKLYCSSTSCCC